VEAYQVAQKSMIATLSPPVADLKVSTESMTVTPIVYISTD